MKNLFLSLFLAFSLPLCLPAQERPEWKILCPRNAAKVYRHAADEFRDFYRAVTGRELEIVQEPAEGVPMVVIGSDCVNRFTRDAVERRLIAPLDLGAESDAYRIVSARDGERDLLFLAGGNGRATLYAVYDFFERQAGCRYFWDGDVIPARETIPMTGLDVRETPHFYYRGLRYFAHRSLGRFQAEHWGPREWEREIDWMLKKRLNLFMLRIGMDDVFQKAFPDVVPYPPADGPLPEAKPRSFYDRTTAWSLEYRGELRRHILRYAAERELIHPEDMGTMTHWYSCTPKAFLEAENPSFCPQSGCAYVGDPCNAVWDIRDDRNLDNYWKLTQTHIDAYGSPQMFHTIGIAEREVFEDRSDNLEMKLYAYRRILAKLREHYPTAPVLIASWDFYLPGWKGEEIGRLLSQLDPARTIILDYTSDLPSNQSNTDFTNWGVVGRFPYTFGIFHAYEWENDIRGYYDLIAERLPVAASDPMCKGFVFWPETSHSDPLVMEFFTRNAWSPDAMRPEELLPEFCRDRYGRHAAVMERAWRAALPLAELCEELPLRFRDIREIAQAKPDSAAVGMFAQTLERIAPQLAGASDVLDALAAMPYGRGDAFVDRDAIDLARTVVSRLFTVRYYRYLIAQQAWERGDVTAAEVRRAGSEARMLLAALRDVLALHDDYSMLSSLRRIEEVRAPINPAFEQALKGNAENSYCRTYISELFDYYYLPEFDLYMKEIDRELKSRERVLTYDSVRMEMQPIVDAFYARPLGEMTPRNPRPRTEAEFRRQMETLAARLRRM